MKRNRNRRASSIADVSRELGVAVSTVSRVLNGYPDVSAETRARVLAGAEALGYHASAAARNLRRQRTDKLGLVLPFAINYTAEYMAAVITGAVTSAEVAGYNLILYPTAPDQSDQLRRIWRAREVDGLLLRGAGEIDQVLDELRREGAPFVVFGRRVEERAVSYVTTDSVGGALAVVRHLVGLGHRRIAYTARPALSQVNADRYTGYCQGLSEAGIPMDEELVVQTHVEPRSGYRAMLGLLDLEQPPTAVFAIHDLVAIDALQAATDRGLRVPEDLAIVGFDGLPSSLATQPSLTTVREPLSDMGRLAVDALLEQLADPSRPPTRTVLPVELVIRESTVGTSWKEAQDG